MLIDRGGVALLAKSAASMSGAAAAANGGGAPAAAGPGEVGPGKEWLVGLLGEVVLCTKESNSRAREASFELLAAIGASALREGGQAAFVDVLTMVQATLAGRTSHIKSAGVIALSRMFYEFRSEPAMQVG